ncbi:hypothetical protein D3C71_2019830 [compost metagenome]
MHLAVAGDLGKHPGQLFVQAGVDGVHRLGPVQTHGQHASVQFKCDEFVMCVVHETSVRDRN